MPVDAEDWLASRGVRREPVLTVDVDEVSASPVAAPLAPAPALDEKLRDQEASGELTAGAALAFIRRSTSNAPQSEGRLRTKLADRGFADSEVEDALVLARAERLVDDAALLTALIAERRSRGHADIRLRRDLRDRGFTGTQVDQALERHVATDPAAAAFALAREQAARHRTIDAEAAVRRTIGFLVRRGHGEGLARKAARDAIYADREAQQIAER